MEGNVKLQHAEDETSLAVLVGFDDFAVIDAENDVIDGNTVFEGFGKRMIDDIEITGFNLLANYQDVHVRQVYAADTEKSRRKGGSSHAANARPTSAKSADSYSSVFAFLCVLYRETLSFLTSVVT